MTYGLNVDNSPSPTVNIAITVGTTAARRHGVIVTPPTPSVSVSYSQQPDTLEKEFAKHSKRWIRDTVHLSSPSEKYLHPSYARIMGLGAPAVRLILRSLEKQPADWFYALRAMTGANPVTSAMAGDMDQMMDAWLQWGRDRNLV